MTAPKHAGAPGAAPAAGGGSTPSRARNERRHRETREEILRVARRLVIEQGAESLTVREVARRCDFSAPALYRYFEHGREEILLGIARGSLAVMESHLRRVPAGLPPDERIVEMGVAYLRFAREHPQEVTLLFDSIDALGPLDEAGDPSQLLAPLGLFELVLEALQEGAAAGIFRFDEKDAELVMHGAWAYVHGLAVVERLHERHGDLFGDRARELLRVYVNGLGTDWAAVPEPTGARPRGRS
jgi:AcrR family transcriptional regulator